MADHGRNVTRFGDDEPMTPPPAPPSAMVEKVASAIFDELNDRSGIGLDGIDADVLAELRDTVSRLAIAAMLANLPLATMRRAMIDTGLCGGVDAEILLDAAIAAAKPA